MNKTTLLSLCIFCRDIDNVWEESVHDYRNKNNTEFATMHIQPVKGTQENNTLALDKDELTNKFMAINDILGHDSLSKGGVNDKDYFDDVSKLQQTNTMCIQLIYLTF